MLDEDTEATTEKVPAEHSFEDDGQIPDLELTFKGETGYVRFGNTDDLSGRDVKMLRRMAVQEDTGKGANDFLEQQLRLLVTEWKLPGMPDARIPRYDKQITDRIPGKMLRLIEKHIQPHMEWLAEDRKKKTGDDLFEAGGPTAPASA